MKLYVDDNRKTPAGWTRAYTAEEAKLYLLHGDVEDLSLDHDLDMPECSRCQFQCGHRGHHSQPGPVATPGCAHGCSCHDQGAETGLDLTRWMVRTGRWPASEPTVHSHNIDNALRMKKLIAEHYPRRK